MNISNISRYIAQINIKSTKARLLQHSEPPRLTISREKGGLEIESNTIKLDIDNRAFFDSMGLKSNKAFAEEITSRGQKVVLESMGDSAEEADIMAEPHNNDAISEIAVMRTRKSIETMLAFIPEYPPECHWTGGDVDIQYTPDRLNFDWQIKDIQNTYIPYKVEFDYQE